jgi:hypothetical protein
MSMRIEFEIEDQLAADVLAQQGVTAAMLDEADIGAEQLVMLITRAALDVLGGRASSGEAVVEIDRAKLEHELLAIAGAQRPISIELEGRGTPIEVWTPQSRWTPLVSAPDGYHLLEERLSAIFDLLATNPELGTLVSRRSLPTGERFQEAVFATVEEAVSVRVRLPGGSFRFRLAPDGLLVIGSPEGAPERIREGR